MKKMIFALTIVVSQNVLASGLADALSQAIQNSDGEKTLTKATLLVTDDHIEKATFKRGQKKQVIKDESTVLADNTYTAPEKKREVNNEEASQIEALEKELSVKGL